MARNPSMSGRYLEWTDWLKTALARGVELLLNERESDINVLGLIEPLSRTFNTVKKPFLAEAGALLQKEPVREMPLQISNQPQYTAVIDSRSSPYAVSTAD